MLTLLKRDGPSRAVLGRSILGGVALALLLAIGLGGPVTGFLAASPALAQDRHDDRDHRDDHGRDRHPYYYRQGPVYAPPAVIYAPPGPSPAIDFVFPINIR
jgi:hypothetical protein